MDFNEFEKAVKQLDQNKYHIGRVVGFSESGKFIIQKWDIFRKDMSEKEYYDEKNLAVLSSEKGNTIEDIKKLIKGEI